jgi:hypothetical protein
MSLPRRDILERISQKIHAVQDRNCNILTVCNFCSNNSIRLFIRTGRSGKTAVYVIDAAMMVILGIDFTKGSKNQTKEEIPPKALV